MRHFVYSTLTNDHRYTNWTRPDDQKMLPKVISEVLIKGGANRANVHGLTPLGIRTEVTDEQLESLKANKIFGRHCEQKLILVYDELEDPEIVARKHMQSADPSAPLTPNSEIFQRVNEDGEKIIPKSNGSILSRIANKFS